MQNVKESCYFCDKEAEGSRYVTHEPGVQGNILMCSVHLMEYDERQGLFEDNLERMWEARDNDGMDDLINDQRTEIRESNEQEAVDNSQRYGD